eukprot:jgi/Chrzof1/13547/Cz08g01180.t1
MALTVTIPTCADTFSIRALNAPSTDFPFLGGIQGDDDTNVPPGDLASGSYAFAYLGGTDETPVGSPPTTGGNTYNEAFPDPARLIESGIWSNTGLLTPQWVNTDGSKPATFIVRSGFDFFALTGDFSNFHPGTVEPQRLYSALWRDDMAL